MLSSYLPLAVWLLVVEVLAAPAPVYDPRDPMITPPPRLEDRVPEKRDIDFGSYLNSVISGLGSDVSSLEISGVPNFFQGYPTGAQVESSLGISDSDLAASPTKVLNLPPYGNWTDKGWNVRVHGNVYKQPNISESKLNELADVFLVNTSIASLPASQQDQARNLTAEIFVVQQPNVNVTMNFVNDVDVTPGASGGVINAQGGAQTIQLPYETTDEGDFDTFIILANTTGSKGGHLQAGNSTSSIQALNIYANGTLTGNATAYLVPPQGFTIVSDIDDILRVTKIYEPSTGLFNTFAAPFTPWMNMPQIYANWSAKIPNFHFHYLTTTPEQITANYMDFIYKTYPLGSFDTRPLNFSNADETLSVRRFLLDKLFQTFPQRKFILVGDTTNSDIMKDYPALVQDYPNQVQCIFLRNTSSTDSGDLFPYDTSGFKGLNQNQYMFFHVPDDLTNLDIVGGNCYNASIKQNVTFKEQGQGFGNTISAANTFPAAHLDMAVALSFLIMLLLAF